MEYGIFTSDVLEIVKSRYWTLCFYCNTEKTYIGSRLYNGNDDDKTLMGICERDIENNKILYAYELPSGQIHTNDNEGVAKLIETRFEYDISQLRKIDDIQTTDHRTLTTVSKDGIKACLKHWRMGTSYFYNEEGMQFNMITNKVEYTFLIRNRKYDIYCGAFSVIPYENGLLGSEQYFRLRNFGDNTESFCGFHCNIGGDIKEVMESSILRESGTCNMTSQGLFWPVKRYTDNEIVLNGCGGEEYIYKNDSRKSEYFYNSDIKGD